MTTRRRSQTIPFNRSLPLLAVLLAAAPALATQYTYKPLDHNGNPIWPYGIGNSGIIVGEEKGTQKSFVLGLGYTTVSAPDDRTKPQDISDTVVFYGVNASGVAIGEVRVNLYGGPPYDAYFCHKWQNGAYGPAYFRDFHYRGINDNGAVVGYYTDSITSRSRGLTSSGGYNVPGALATEIYGINNNNRIIGSYLDDNDRNHAFYKDEASPNPVILDPGFPLIPYTLSANGINDHGDIVGTIHPDYDNISFGYVYTQAHGFQSIGYPGAPGTYPYGINNAGVIVGVYEDAQEHLHGFVATPVPYFIGEVVSTLQFAGGLDNFQGVSDPSRQDIDGDGRVTLLDAALMMRKISGLDPN